MIAQQFYAEARQRWAEALELSLQESESAIYAVQEILDRALLAEPEHRSARWLLALLQAQRGSYPQALLLLQGLGQPELESLLKAAQPKAIQAEVERHWNLSDW